METYSQGQNCDERRERREKEGTSRRTVEARVGGRQTVVRPGFVNVEACDAAVKRAKYERLRQREKERERENEGRERT